MSPPISDGCRTRRRLLGGLGLLAATALAGCSGSSTTAEASEDLDLREANVVGVEVSEAGDDYEFSVTLHHDDDGEDGYANWWQIERPDGTQLGRRDLAHAHAEQPFTRSGTVSIPDDVGCVVVRGHDQTHGYGGRAMVVTIGSGSTRAIDQGAEPESFEGDGCP